MEAKVKLKYMGKPIQASYEHDCRDGKDYWIFTTDDKAIVVASSNLPITPPVGQRPVEIRPARLKRRLQAGRIIHYQDCCEISGGIKNCDLFNKAKRQISLKDAATIAAASNLLKTLKRYGDGTIMPIRGGQSIDRFINGFHHEAVFQDSRAVLVIVTENTVAPDKAKIKRVQLAKRHGKRGGAPIKDGEKIRPAIAKVFELLKTKKSKTMERACNIVIKDHQLLIKWQALAKQVRKSPQWKNMKKRIAIERKQPM